MDSLLCVSTHIFRGNLVMTSTQRKFFVLLITQRHNNLPLCPSVTLQQTWLRSSTTTHTCRWWSNWIVFDKNADSIWWKIYFIVIDGWAGLKYHSPGLVFFFLFNIFKFSCVSYLSVTCCTNASRSLTPFCILKQLPKVKILERH